MGRCVDGQMCGCVDVWMVGFVGGRMCGWVDVWSSGWGRCVWVDVRMCGCTDVWVGGCVPEWMVCRLDLWYVDGFLNGCVAYGWLGAVNEWVDVKMDKQVDGWVVCERMSGRGKMGDGWMNMNRKEMQMEK